MMDSGIYIPKPPLSEFIAFFWHQEARPRGCRQESCLPMGTVELVIDLTDIDREPVLCGPHNRPFVLDNPGACSVVGVHFRPGGFFPFLRAQPHEIQNAVLSLRDVWGQEAVHLRDRVLEAPTLARRYEILEDALVAHAPRGFNRREEVSFAMRQLSKPGTRVSDLAGRIGYSPRHFAEMFKGEVGLTPKSYAQVQRFQRVISLLSQPTEANWAEIALDTGYFDQAHFANDFREFSGLTPSAYLAVRTPHLNHVPILD